MTFAQAFAAGPDLAEVAQTVVESLRRQLGPDPLDLVVAFASARYAEALDALPTMLHEGLTPQALIGCTGASLLDGARGGSEDQGVVVLAGRAPGARCDAIAVDAGDLPDADGPPSSWRALFPPREEPCTGMLVLGEPFHLDPRELVGGLDFAFPGVPKVGGIASGSRHPQGHALFCGRRTLRRGAVALALGGGLSLTPVVATGCRPFGRAGRITRSEGNRLIGVDDRTAKEFVKEQLRTLDEAAREVAVTSPLLLGLEADPFADSPDAEDDLLVRSIHGVDAQGHLVVGEHLPVGRTIRLLMRDTSAGAEDALRQLRRAKVAGAEAALLFRCLGRESDDCGAFTAANGDAPLIGFGCNGEIGPLGGATALHAFTAAYAILRRTGA